MIVEPSKIFETSFIFFIVSAKYMDGEAITRKSLLLATSIISFETVIDSESLYPDKNFVFSCCLFTKSFTSGSNAHI